MTLRGILPMMEYKCDEADDNEHDSNSAILAKSIIIAIVVIMAVTLGAVCNIVLIMAMKNRLWI